MASYLQMAGMQMNSKEPVIDLDEINGIVHLTHNLSLGLFESTTISGLLKGPVKNCAYYKCVNVSIEPMTYHLSDDSKFCAVPGYIFLKPGSHKIHVMMKNLTAREVIIHQGAKVAMMSAANVVPHMLAPQEEKLDNPENENKVTMKSASVMEETRGSSIEGGVQKSSIEQPYRHDNVKNKNPELDRTPLIGEQLEKLYELIKLNEGTVNWTTDISRLFLYIFFLWGSGGCRSHGKGGTLKEKILK